MRKLSVGVVGLGLGTRFAKACAESSFVERVVLCDPDGERLARLSESIPAVAGGYPDIGDMLEREAPDAVVVVTPDHLHRSHSVQCLQAGCHVLQTKPLATNLDDARGIVDAGDKAGRILMVAHERRFRTRIMAIRDLLRSGALGEVVTLRIDAIQDKRGQFERAPWYASAEAGRSALVGSGIHEVDLLRHLIGASVEEVSAFSNRLGSLQFPKDKTTAAIFRFAGGAVGQVTVTYEAHWPAAGAIDDHFRLIGTKGLIVGTKYATDDDGCWRGLPVDDDEIGVSVSGCVNAFLDVVVNGMPNPMDGGEAFASLAAAVAADVSAASGGPVRPEALDPA